MMKDKAFLIWIHQRLVKVHNESPAFDYMHKLRAIIRATPEDKVTLNIASDTSELDDYCEQFPIR